MTDESSPSDGVALAWSGARQGPLAFFAASIAIAFFTACFTGAPAAFVSVALTFLVFFGPLSWPISAVVGAFAATLGSEKHAKRRVWTTVPALTLLVPTLVLVLARLLS